MLQPKMEYFSTKLRREEQFSAYFQSISRPLIVNYVNYVNSWCPVVGIF